MGVKAIIVELIIVILTILIKNMGIKAFNILVMICIEMVFLYGMIWGREWK